MNSKVKYVFYNEESGKYLQGYWNYSLVDIDNATDYGRLWFLKWYVFDIAKRKLKIKLRLKKLIFMSGVIDGTRT